VTDAESRHQNALDEMLRGEVCERGVERQHHRHVEAELADQPDFLGQRGQPELRVVGLEVVARMRLEHDHAASGLRGLGLVQRLCQQRLVAAMDAVEIADGEYRTSKVQGNMIETVLDQHRSTLTAAPRGAS